MKNNKKIRAFFSHVREILLGNETLRGNEGVPESMGIISASSYDVIEVDGLLDVVDHSKTLVGKETIHKSFTQTNPTVDEIKSKQQALRELDEDQVLRNSIDSMLDTAIEYEDSFYRLLFAEFTGFIFSPDPARLEEAGYGYRLYEKGSQFLPQVLEQIKQIKEPKSQYLKGLLAELLEFSESREFKLMRGPVHMLMGKFLLQDEMSWYTPAIKLRLNLFKPMLIPILFLITIAMPYILNISMAQFTVFALVPFILLVFYVPMVGDFDKDAFIIPLRRLFSRSEKVERAVRIIGLLDELLSYHKYSKNCVHPTVLPNINVHEQHVISLKEAVNPVLGFNDKNYVPNDFDASKHNLAFFTGPNSGGKTAFCKTIAQIQLMAQVGCYVPAEHAELSVADRVFYQTPEINSLDEDVGRFGTELKHTRDIFLEATPNSLVILDELAEGTTHKEKIETSLMILGAFKKLGSLTLLVTHNHELAESFKDGGQAVFLQVEFNGEKPTHRFVEGVSVISHADLVARSVGFSKDDIERILQEKLRAKSTSADA
ncbi:MAG: DNA mismatch repair protein MutS [Piscirickettsiaceae bacterium]|nr:MAG: DNA mismatch repair protein MutS [Piscirickettsiaceae bacterium]